MATNGQKRCCLKEALKNEVHLPCTFSVALFWAFTTKGMNGRTNEWAALRANQ